MTAVVTAAITAAAGGIVYGALTPTAGGGGTVLDVDHGNCATTDDVTCYRHRS
ncbi:hypothetical protein [Streptomyces sp. NPDC001492]